MTVTLCGCGRPMGDGDRVTYGQCGPCRHRAQGRPAPRWDLTTTTLQRTGR